MAVKGTKALGARLQQWHSSMGDPIYAVGSSFYAGRTVSLNTARAAMSNLVAARKAAKAAGQSDKDIQHLDDAKRQLADRIHAAAKAESAHGTTEEDPPEETRKNCGCKPMVLERRANGAAPSEGGSFFGEWEQGVAFGLAASLAGYGLYELAQWIRRPSAPA